NYSWGAAQFFLPHVIGTFGPVNGEVTDWPSVIKHTRLIVAFGGLALKNGQVTSGGAGAHVMEQWLRRAKDAGIAFVVVSPNRADAPDFLDAQWLPIRPNTDTAMMLAMAHTLLAEQRHDAEFLERYCAGFDTFARYLLGTDDGQPKSPEWAETICGVSAATIRDLARRMAAARSLVTCAWSLQRAHHGEQPYWAASACPAAASPSAMARPTASARPAPTCRVPNWRRRSIRRGAPCRSPALPTCCARPAPNIRSTAIAPSIRTSGWSIGPAAIRFITIRTSIACSAPGRSRRPSSSTTAGGRRRRGGPISCCRRPRRSSATMSAARCATTICSPCISRLRRSEKRATI